MSACVAWFKRDGRAYWVKIGRRALKFGEYQWFAAATLDEVIERLKMTKEVISDSDAFKQQIVQNSNARSERAGHAQGQKAA